MFDTSFYFNFLLNTYLLEPTVFVFRKHVYIIFGHVLRSKMISNFSVLSCFGRYQNLLMLCLISTVLAQARAPFYCEDCRRQPIHSLADLVPQC